MECVQGHHFGENDYDQMFSGHSSKNYKIHTLDEDSALSSPEQLLFYPLIKCAKLYSVLLKIFKISSSMLLSFLIEHTKKF